MDINERIAALQVGSCTDVVDTVSYTVKVPMSNDSAGFTVSEMLDEQEDLTSAVREAGHVTTGLIVQTLHMIRDFNLRERRKLRNPIARENYQPRLFVIEPTQRMAFHHTPRRLVTEITIRIRRVK